MITQKDIDAMDDGMSDLVKRLRDGTSDFDDWEEAADHIEQLERELERARVSREDDGMQIIGLQAQLTAEKALADRLHDVLYASAFDGKNRASAAYRKARGL